MLQQDTRAFVAKYSKNLPVFIGLNGSSMGDNNNENDTKKNIIELLKETFESTFVQIVEICYSKTKASSIIQEQKNSFKAMMSGPDMFHFVDSITDKIKMNIWQPIYLKTKVQIDFYDDNEKVKKNYLLDINNKTNENVVNEILDVWKKETKKEWTRTKVNNNDFILIL